MAEEQPVENENDDNGTEKSATKSDTDKAMTEKKIEKVPVKNSSSKLAVVLVRGLAKTPNTIKRALALLNISRKNECVLLDNNPVNKGMINKVKDYVAWGEVSEQTIKELVEKRGRLFQGREEDRKGKYKYNYLEYGGKKYRKSFHLNPPQKGFGRKGIKMAFKVGGALGYRGEKMNDLIVRMI